MLQETYSTPDIELAWRKDWERPMYFCHGSNHSRGVLLLFAKNVDVKVKEEVKDVDGRFILSKGLIWDMRLSIGNVYFPTR